MFYDAKPTCRDTYASLAASLVVRYEVWRALFTHSDKFSSNLVPKNLFFQFLSDRLEILHSSSLGPIWLLFKISDLSVQYEKSYVPKRSKILTTLNFSPSTFLLNRVFLETYWSYDVLASSRQLSILSWREWAILRLRAMTGWVLTLSSYSKIVTFAIADTRNFSRRFLKDYLINRFETLHIAILSLNLDN